MNLPNTVYFIVRIYPNEAVTIWLSHQNGTANIATNGCVHVFGCMRENGIAQTVLIRAESALVQMIRGKNADAVNQFHTPKSMYRNGVFFKQMISNPPSDKNSENTEYTATPRQHTISKHTEQFRNIFKLTLYLLRLHKANGAFRCVGM